MADQPELFPGAAATPVRRRARQKAIAADAAAQQATRDSFQNFGLNLGLGTDNALTGSSYGFNPITRIRTLLEWIYRGSWIGAVGVDLVADDMTRAGVEIMAANLDPEDIDQIQRTATSLGVWNSINDTEKWARLYGGAIAVLLIDGQDMATPLREDTIRPGQFKGLVVFDRWSVTPSARLVAEFGPCLGQPDGYIIGGDAPALRGQTVHYSRCLRLVGVELPWQQRIAEDMWGLSIIERLYDRMIAFDSATQGAAQLVYKAANRTYKIKGMRQLIAAGADALQIMLRYVEATRKFAGIEGMTLIDAEDDMVTTQLNVQGGISDALVQFGQQISGALQIPLVRLFGQSPAGLNSTGESDLRTYYDGIANQQNKELREPVLKIFRILTRSCGFQVDQKFNIKFNALWQMTEPQKSEVAERDARSIADLFGQAIFDKPTALRSLRDVNRVTGRFGNITDEMVAQAELEPPPDAAGLLGGPGAEEGDEPEDGKPPLMIEDKRAKTERRANDRLPFHDFQGLQLAIETPRGDVRRGPGWQIEMPADYGFIRGTSSAEGAFEQMDCFVGTERSSPAAFVIDSKKPGPGGGFDEHKVMLGFLDEQAAVDCFRAAYHDAREPMAVTRLEMSDFRRWLRTGDPTRALSEQSFIHEAPPIVAVR